MLTQLVHVLINLSLKTMQVDIGRKTWILLIRFGVGFGPLMLLEKDLPWWPAAIYPLALAPKITEPPAGTTEGHTCLMSSSWRILILSLSIWILWSRSFCCCCCWVVRALGMLMSPAGGFWVGWFCWLRVVGAICCWCWWFITIGGKNTQEINKQVLQHLIKKRPSECPVLCRIDSWDSFRSTFLLIITVSVTITLIQFMEAQILAPLLTHLVLAFCALLKVTSHLACV